MLINWNCALGDAPPATLPCAPVVALAPRDDSVDTNTVVITGTGTISSFGDAPRVTKQVFFAAGQTLHHNPPALSLMPEQDRVIAGPAHGTYMCDGSGHWYEVAYEGSGQPPALGIATGTVMLFVQPTAPVGWTKLTTHNDKALRIVSGTTGGGSGGAHSFSALFGPAEYTEWSNEYSIEISPGDHAPFTINYIDNHRHAIDLSVQYVDVILASKN